MMPSPPIVPRAAATPGRLPRVALALLLSLAVHGAALWSLSRPVPPRAAPSAHAPFLVVRLAPQPPAPPPLAPAEPEAVRPPPRPERTARPARRPAAPETKAQEKNENDHLAAEQPRGAASPTPPTGAAPAAQPRPLDLDTDAAVHAALHPRKLIDRPVATLPRPGPEPEAPTALGQRMAQAAIPDCLRPDATSKTGIPVGGLLALPVLAYAKLAGKCH